METRIVAVSYVNTKPFIFGIEQSGILNEGFELKLAHPSDCGTILLNGDAEIGLVPVALLSKLPDYEVITDFCIGAEGKVDTVCLYSEVPLPEIKKICLDYQSRTSVELVQVLAKKFWQINPKWEPATPGFEEQIKGDSAALIIGDRAFSHSGKHTYVYDLAEEWKKFTGKPFVFACWVAKKQLNKEKIGILNRALEVGVSTKDQYLNEIKKEYSQIDIEDYLSNKIRFRLTSEMRSGLEHFLQYLSTPVVNH